MKGFNILAYLRRVVKYVVFYTILIVAMLAVVYFTSDNPNITFWELIQPGQQKNLILLIVAFSLLYPFLGFSKKEIFTNRPMTEAGRSYALPQIGFIQESDRTENVPGHNVCHASSGCSKTGSRSIIRNPVVIEGMRGDIQRIAAMEHFFQRSREE